MKTNLKSFTFGASLTLGLLGVYALAVSIPNAFTAGDVISAAKMNANFDAMKTAVDSLETKAATTDTKTAALESAQRLVEGPVAKQAAVDAAISQRLGEGEAMKLRVV